MGTGTGAAGVEVAGAGAGVGVGPAAAVAAGGVEVAVVPGYWLSLNHCSLSFFKASATSFAFTFMLSEIAFICALTSVLKCCHWS